jgi:hypothetical protein
VIDLEDDDTASRSDDLQMTTNEGFAWEGGSM